MTGDWIHANRRSYQRLEQLVERLSSEQYQHILPGGWSVAALLGHLAFWDFRALALIQRWQVRGIAPSPVDIEDINAAVKPILSALDGPTAASLAVQAAEAIDQALEAAEPELIAAIEGLGGKFRLDRSLHRDEHLDQIEAVLAREAG